MRFRNTPWAYGPMARFNHWLGAILILAMLALGLIFPTLSPGAGKTFLRILHISIGTALLPLALWRLFWRFSVPAPLPLNHLRSRQVLTQIVHLVLLGCLVVMLASGVLMQWFGGRQIGIFNIVHFVSPLAASGLWEERMAQCHGMVAWLLIGLLAIHLLALAYYSVRHGARAWARMGGQVRR